MTVSVVFGETPRALAIGATRDVSTRGLCISSRVVHSTGTKLFVRVALPDGGSVELVGTVTWTRPSSDLLGFDGQMGLRVDHGDRSFLRFVMGTDPGAGLPSAPPATGDGPAAEPARPRLVVTRMPRRADQLPFRFGPGSALTERGFTTDLSARGIGFRGANVPAHGEQMFVALSLPDGRVARASGTVAWRSADRADGLARAGVRLDNADEAFFQYVLRLLERSALTNVGA